MGAGDRVNAAAILNRARAAGAAFRLAPDGTLHARRLGRLPADLQAGVRVQRAAVAAVLVAEAFDRDPLPWRPHGAGWLALVHRHDGSFTLHALPGRQRSSWSLTVRDPAGVLHVAGRNLTLLELLDAAHVSAGSATEAAAS